METINETVREQQKEIRSTRRIKKHESSKSIVERSKIKKKETEPLNSPKIVEKKKVGFESFDGPQDK